MGFEYDLIVIGSGPAGYVAGIRAAQLGMKTVVVEQDRLGGTCLNMGCIPSKALIRQAELYLSLSEAEKTGVVVDRSGFNYRPVFEASRKAADTLSKGVQFLLKKNEVEVRKGRGTIAGPNEVSVDDGTKLFGRFILVATGSRPREIPGFPFDGKKILSSDHALLLEELPGRLLLIGGGAIGCEFAHIMSAFGVQVTVVEMLDHLLPLEDQDMAVILERAFRKRKIDVFTGASVSGWRETGDGLLASVKNRDGETQEIAADRILVVTGRAPNTSDIGLERIGITLDRGTVPVGDYYQTSVPSVFAVGDIIAAPQLAHLASAEAEIAVEFMAGRKPHPKADLSLVPRAVYTEPQIAGIGASEAALKTQGVPYTASVFQYRATGKAVATGRIDGQVKILFHPETREILGAGIVGADATELIHELILARTAGLTPADLAEMIHAHPTLSEAVMEAARGAEGWMIHA